MNPGFKGQKIKGKKVEEIVKEHLIARGHKVTDVSENAAFQTIDTDFIVSDGNRSVSLEVKRDDNISKTANFFFEVESEDEYGRRVKGWAQYTEADYLCFYDTNINKGYILDWKAVKENLSTLGRVEYFFDKIDQKMTKAKLVSTGAIKRRGFIVYEWRNL